jgi:hypothetical protein
MNRTWGVLVGAVLLLAATNAWAQATAQINGTVADSSGAVLPGVTVVAIQTDTGFRRESVTDQEGAYALLNLPIGPYRLEASLQGFRSFVQTGIQLQVSSNPVIKVTLELGQLSETLTVEGQAPLVETRNPAVGNVMTNAQVEALPMEGRNVASLVVTVGATVDTGNPSSRSLTQSRGIAIAGGQQFGVAYVLDGALHNNVYDGDNLPMPFPDAVQEFKIETSSQQAQNGYKAGGTASFATKAGTNQFHGDAFEFARHHRFNATSPFASVNRRTGKRFDDGLVRNQFGGVLGGPIVRDRIFFFGAYQGTRTTQTPADIITFIPTAQMLAGDFSDCRLGAVPRPGQPGAAGGARLRQQPDQSGALQPRGGEDCEDAAADDRSVRPDRLFADDQAARSTADRACRLAAQSEPSAVRALPVVDDVLGARVPELRTATCSRQPSADATTPSIRSRSVTRG